MDEQGRPLRLYHGTSKDQDFKHFNVPTRGAWFTSDPREASDYSTENDSRTSGWDGRQFVPRNTASRVIPVFVRATNPAVFDGYPEMIRLATHYAAAQRGWMAALRAEGHDAAVVGLRDGTRHVIVLGGPEQIKSAIGNRSFDPKRKGMAEDRG